MAERLAQDRQRTDADARERATAAATQERARQSAIEQARAEVQESRENRVALALLLMLLALVTLGGALVMLMKDRQRHAYILGGVGTAFVVAAAIAFLTRPHLADAAVPSAEPAATAADAPSAAFAGRHSCRFVPERSRVTVSSTPNVDLEWSAGGCVNGRTQYAEHGEIWRRILVPQGDQTVSVLEVHPGGRQYVVNRYLLPAEAMSRARALRRRIELAACTAEEPRMAALAAGQEEIRRILRELPNERLVYDCATAG
jgi:hypothetical protein